MGVNEELAARAAKLAHPLFEAEGWTYGTDKEIPDEEELASAVEYLLSLGGEWSTGRFHTEVEGGTVRVLLELGAIHDGQVDFS